MKKMRKLLPAFAMLLVSAVMMSTASFAWFSMGTKASADGMQVKATASSSLVIDNNVANLTSADQSVSFTSAATALKPATHSESFTTKLGRPNDEYGINAGTGIMDDDNTLVEAGAGYYVDYVVYIATTGAAALEDKTLYANIAVPATLSNYIHNAVTIDFWMNTFIDEAGSGNAFCTGSTTNFNTVVTTGAASGTDKVLKVAIATGCDIPLLVESETDDTLSYIAITMRVYFDGDLKDGDVCYIRNTKASVTEAAFSVEFSAE